MGDLLKRKEAMKKLLKVNLKNRVPSPLQVGALCCFTKLQYHKLNQNISKLTFTDCHSNWHQVYRYRKNFLPDPIR
ncbi:hypothetical protein L2E82_17002 [Cichorium intybus]|uniref:Uncharacterized protein n=1 Tax=Cichorium intybus TaxID=13427 RepID=A0ACB9F825_CICIN|nr:hypothetical protein L2E82_17002 [Cichorium intybus]